MKRFLFAALAITVMASCTKNETLEQEVPTGINFGVVKGNSVATKGENPLPPTDGLGVFAYRNNAVVSPPTTAFALYESIGNMLLKHDGTIWSLYDATSTAVVKNYPANDDVIGFWAYGPKDDANLGNTITCDAKTGPTFTLTLTNADADVDIYATKKVEVGRKSDNAAITFKLERIMAQVKFEAYVGTNPANYACAVTDITVKAKGTANYAAGKWTNLSNDLTWVSYDSNSSPFSVTATTPAFVAGSLSLNLIPGNINAEITIGITIGGVAYSRTIMVNNWDYPVWEQGKQYTYTIQIDPTIHQPIGFGQPTVSDNWDTPETSEIVV